MSKGKVKWFNDRKGYGFINLEEEPEKDIFVYYKDIEEEGYKKLCEGEPVEFEYQNTDRGPTATHVKKLDVKPKK